MSPEELKRLRDYANHYQGSDVYFLITHIDEQEERITLLESDNKFLHRFVDAPGSILEAALNDIKRLLTQNIMLRAALISERARVLYFAHCGDLMYDDDLLRESYEMKDKHISEACDQLAYEFTDFGW